MICDRYPSLLVQHVEIGHQFLCFLIYSDDHGAVDVFDPFSRKADGKFEIDNNLVENSIRPMALGRKNYLFAGNHQAAQNAAMMYSFFGTCKKLNINPNKWLPQVLEKLPYCQTDKDYEDLLPVNFKISSAFALGVSKINSS